MQGLASTLDCDVFGRLIIGLAQASLDGASEPVPVLIKRLQQLETQARAEGLSGQKIHAIASGRRLLGDSGAV